MLPLGRFFGRWVPAVDRRFAFSPAGFRLVSVVLLLGIFFGVGRPLSAQQMFDHIDREDGLISGSVSAIVQDDYGFMWFGTQAGLQRYDGTEMILYTNEPFAENQLSHHLVQTLFYDGGDELWVGTYGGLNRLNIETQEFSEYTHESGEPDSLSNNVVVSVARDMHGSLWVGTLDGLNRLDDEGDIENADEGESEGTFTRFEPDEDNENSIAGATIRALFLDSRERFWVGSVGGLSQLEYDRNGEPVFTPYSDDLPSDAVMAIDEDRDGNLWIGTWDGGLSRLGPDGAVDEHYTLPDNRVYKVLAAESGLIYAATWGGGVSVLDPETGEQTQHVAEDDNTYSLAHDVTYSLHEDHSGIIWVGTNGAGISRLDPLRDDYRLLGPDLPQHLQLPSGKVSQLLFDEPTGQLYVAVQDGGLHAYDPATAELTGYRHDPANPDSLSNDQVNDIARHGEALMVATNSGLDRFDPAEETFTALWNEFEDAEESDTDDGNTDGGGTGSSDPDTEDPPIVYALDSAEDGSLWAGTYDRGVRRRMPDGTVRRYARDPDDDSSLSDNLIYEIFQEASGTIWVGTNRGLNRYRPETDDFVRYLHDPENSETISDNTIVHMLEDSRSRLWIATRSGGVSRYHRDSDTFSHITTADGLSSNLVRAVNEHSPGILYAATMHGMNRIDLESDEVYQLPVRTGLATREFNSGTARLPGGDLAFGAYSSVLTVNDRRRTSDTEPPHIQLTGISVMHKPYAPSGSAHGLDSIELPHTDNTVGFRFATLDFAVPEGNRQRYRLSGFESQWSEWTFSNDVTYTNIPPGEYTFEVQGQDSHGTPTRRTARIGVRIVPPIWRTTWFAGAATVFLLAVLWGILRWRTQQLTRRAELLEAQVAERTQELSQANDALRQSNATKDRFFSLLSHDLRGPVSGIRQLMQQVIVRDDSYDSDKLAEIHSALFETSRGLETMLDNLLEWSRLQTERITLTAERIVVSELLESITEAYRGALLSKQLSIRVDCPPELTVHTDMHRSRTVLENLLNNAIKFSQPGGSIQLRGARMPAPGSPHEAEDSRRRQDSEPLPERSSQPGSRGDGMQTGSATTVPLVVIEVEDTGEGIPAERLDTLFDVGTTVRTEGTAGEHGSGLGLTLCHELMEKLGGTITLESELGKGTTARVTFPE
ncbi:MAG: two-component regulator propeller domain-containing protein, partial [bacterium]